MRRFSLMLLLVTFTGCGSPTDTSSESLSPPPQPGDGAAGSTDQAQVSEQPTTSPETSQPTTAAAVSQPSTTPNVNKGLLQQASQSPGHKFVADFMTAMVKGTPQDLSKVTYLGYPKSEFSKWAGTTGNRKVTRVWDPNTGDWETRRRTQVLQNLQELATSLKPLNVDLSTLEIVEIQQTDDIKVILATKTHFLLLKLDDCIQTPHGVLCFDSPRMAIRLKTAGPIPEIPREGSPPAVTSRPSRRDDFPTLSPFSRVSCQGDVATVTYNGRPMQLVSLNGLPAKRILDYCKQQYGGNWEKRFAEDLVQVLSGMGQKVGNTCSLVLKNAAGKVVKVEQAKMTRELRQQVWRARREQPRSATPTPFSRVVASATLKKLRRAMEDRWAYFRASESDFDRHFAAAEKQVSNGRFDGAQGLERFRATLDTLIGHGIDGHARVEVAGVPSGRRFLPFLIRPLGDRFVAFRPDRSGFLAPGTPYITHLGGESGEMVSIESIVERLAPFSPSGSPQYRKHQALRLIRRIDRLQVLLGLELGDRLRVILQQEDKTALPRTPVTIPAADQFPTFGSFPRKPTRLITGGIGYLRIPAMDDQAVAEIQNWMPRFRKTNGLIIDVRGNGGGRRTPLLAIAEFLIGPEEPPVVVNAAKFRRHPDFPENHLANRFLFAAAADHWSQAERETIARFQKRFQPEWIPAANRFSEWHYLVLSHHSAENSFHFDRPVVVLMDDRCFSATDIFLAAIKQLDGVTLLGTPSGGGSARSVSIDLGPARVRLASMASFQADGKLFDGHGVQPDKVVQATPEFFIGRTDRVLASAIQLVTN